MIPSMRTRREFLAGTLGFVAATAVARTSVRAADTISSTFVANEFGYVRLWDGRCLAFADFGDPAGSQVILYHHGLPSCRLEIEVYRDALMTRPGVRMIAIDRPGVGRSSAHAYSSILSWPTD